MDAGVVKASPLRSANKGGRRSCTTPKWAVRRETVYSFASPISIWEWTLLQKRFKQVMALSSGGDSISCCRGFCVSIRSASLTEGLSSAFLGNAGRPGMNQPADPAESLFGEGLFWTWNRRAWRLIDTGFLDGTLSDCSPTTSVYMSLSRWST